MTPLPFVPGVIRLDLNYIQGIDATALTRLFWAYSGGPPTNTDCAVLAAHVSGAWSGFLAGFFDDSTTLSSVEATDLTSASSGQGYYNTPVNGTRGTAILSASACALAQYSIPRRYRGGKPRTYWPAGVQTDLDDRQEWLAAFTSPFEAAIVSFIANVSAGVSGTTALTEQVNVSYYSGVTATPSPTNPARYVNRPNKRAVPIVNPTTFTGVKTKVASQRRRNLQRT